jgi:pteridine reductase
VSDPPTAKTALITGSGRKRLGYVIACQLARRGYDLAIHYHRSEDSASETVRELSKLGVRASAFQADVTDEASVASLFDAVMDRFENLDALVTTSSIWKPIKLEDTTAEDVLASFRVNTLGTFMCCQRAGLIMTRQAAGGAIVTIGDWAIHRPYLDHAAYFTAKGSIPTLTRTLAVELAQRNPRVRVNCIHPGPVMFPDDMSAGEREAVIEATLVKFADRPEWVARTVEYFIDNEFVTGCCLPVDGGRSIFAPQS